MKKHEVIYYDMDGQYAKRLGSYISKRKGIPFSFHVFTDESMLSDYLAREKPEWLLLSEDAKDLCPERLQHSVMFLTEERSLSKQGHFIYKYQSADNIVKELISFYYEGRELSFQKGFSGVTVECVYSPVRRCGKSAFARQRAEELSKNRHTLLVSFDRRRGQIASRADALTFSDLLFYYLELPNELARKLPYAIETIHGYDCIREAVHLEDLFQMTDRDWYVFLSTVTELGAYQALVLDISFEIRGYEALLGLGEVIYMPYIRQETERKLLESEIERLREELGEEFYYRIRCVQTEGGENEEGIIAGTDEIAAGGSFA